MRRNRTCVLVAAALMAGAAGARARLAAPDATYTRPIDPGGRGPRRLAIDVPLLSAAAPFEVIRVGPGQVPLAVNGLRDLHLVDGNGRIVPHSLIDPPLTQAGDGLRESLVVEAMPAEPGRSVYRLRLPGARLPIVAIVLKIGASPDLQTAIVFEPRLSGHELRPSEIGRVTLVRGTVSADGSAELLVPVDTPGEAELDLVMEDGARPAPRVLGAFAQLARLPWIYFESTGEPLSARFGGAKDGVTRPGDLTPPRALAGVAAAAWTGPPVATAAEGTEAQAPGAALPLEEFTRVRRITEGRTGPAALRLDQDVLSRSAGPASSFADVRIVDEGGRQIPYLVEHLTGALAIDLRLEPEASPPEDLRSTPGHSRSTYRLRLPAAPLPGGRLVLETPARVFRRHVRVGAERPADRRRRDPWIETIGEAGWEHDGEGTPPPLAIAVPGFDTAGLLVSVDEGDDGPLPLTAARLLLPSWRLRFSRPGPSPLRLVYGNPGAVLPRYDLTVLAARVVRASVEEVSAEAVTEPDRPPGQLLSSRLFWVLVALAVAVLLVLIARLVVQRPS